MGYAARARLMDIRIPQRQAFSGYFGGFAALEFDSLEDEPVEPMELPSMEEPPARPALEEAMVELHAELHSIDLA